MNGTVVTGRGETTAPPVPRLCLVTTEFHGLFKNGGIGTANTGLALALAAAGFAVTVAFANADAQGPRSQTGDFAELQAQYRTQGIILDHVPPPPEMPAAFNDPRTANLAILAYLRRMPFDIVLFNDNGGQAYYSLLAKRSGTLPAAPQMVVVTHGPYDWVHALNALEYWNREPVIAAFMERRCAAMADRLISPSRYLIDWMRGEGWSLPAETQVIQNLIGPVEPLGLDHPSDPASGAPLREIVFFGRQEIRKGLALFCDAIDALAEAVDIAGLTITILGKFARIGGIHSGVYLVERARHWPARLRVLATASQAEALDHLRRPGVLAVIPSLAENSPCVVAECLQLGLPFLATDSGGTAELLTPEDHAACLVAPDPRRLAARLAESLQRLPAPGRLAVTQAATRDAWLDLVGALMVARDAPPQDAAEAAPPLVSICLCDTAPARGSADWLSRITGQSYPRIEIIWADDGSAPPPSDLTLGRPIRTVTVPDGTIGAARNAAARAAEGAFLLFAEETALLLPDCIAILVGAAQRLGAEILAGLPAIDSEGATPSLVAPLGPCGELGLVENCFGSGVVLIAAGTFRKGAGYSQATAVRDSALLDWVFLAGQVLAGAKLEIVPEPLYRRAPTPHPLHRAGQRLVEGHRQVMQAYGGAALGQFARIAEGLYQIERHYAAERDRALQHVPAGARAIARQLAGLDPNGEEARRAFVAYCCDRRQLALALDFTLLNGCIHLLDMVGQAQPLVAAEALAAIRHRPPEAWYELDLTAAAAERIAAVEATEGLDLLRGAGRVARHALGPEGAILKVPGCCPPGTISLRIRVAGDPPSALAVEVALAVTDPWSRLILSDKLEVAEGMGAWSGWAALPADGSAIELVVTLAAKLDDPGDLYVLSRLTEDGADGAARVTWQRLTAELLMSNGATPSRIQRDTGLLPVPQDLLRAGRLLSDSADFPFPVFVPGRHTLLHPLPGRLALVRLAAAHPAGSSGLRAIVSVRHDQAHPIDFAIWLRPATAAPLDEAALSEAEGFSGWHSVAKPWQRHPIALLLPAPAETALDIYLATRVPGFPDVHFCHANWDEIWTILKPGPKAGRPAHRPGRA